MKEIALTQGQVALVDDEIYEELNRVKWYARKGANTFYAVRMSPRVDGKQYGIYMHHEISGKTPKGFEVDHRNGMGTDNQRENLRHVTRRQNCQNLKCVKSSSKYPGVYWHKPTEKWVAIIKINGKGKNLGYFTDGKEAFETYCQAVDGLGETVIDEEKYLNNQEVI